MIDKLLFLGFRLLVGLLNQLPYRRRIDIATAAIRLVALLIPRYRRIAHRNLTLAFPDKDTAWQNEIIRRSCRSLAAVFVDFIRMPTLDKDWALQHIEFSQIDRLKEIIARTRPKGIMLVAGHLGSFELLPYCMAAMVEPMAFVARNFRQRSIDDWWNGVRRMHGNTQIPRKGAFKGILRHINTGRAVGFLFDQNLVRNNALFVDWFGKPAAVTKALGMAAVRTETTVLLFAIRSVALDRYQLIMREFDFAAIYQDEIMSFEEKALEITRQVSREFEQLIREDPAAWFWMHRRWKTTPVELPGKGFYD